MKHTKKRSVWKWFAIILLLLVVATSAVVGLVYYESQKLARGIHDPLDMESNVNLKNQEPMAMLLLGVDERPDDAGRSDTMIVAVANPQNERLTLLSLPRDLYVTIPGYDRKDKLNHAYAKGGIPLTVETVENVLDIPIDYAVQVNMEAFRDVVDAVGGVDVISPLNFDLEGYHFDKGPLHLTGEEALKYVRMRKEDPRGDFGRQERQRQVLTAILQKGASVQGALRYRSIFDAIEDNVKTNLTFDDLLSLQKHYNGITKDVQQLSFEEEGGQRMNGIWYYVADDEELTSIQNTLKDELHLSKRVAR